MVAGLFVVAEACSSSDTTTATDALITADISSAAADGIAEDVDVMSGMDGTIGNTSANLNGVDVADDVTHGPWTATVSRHRDFTISGLAGTETTRTVNGAGNETISNSRATTNPRAYNLTCSSVVMNVVLPVRTSDGDDGWPISGTITRTCTVTVTAGVNAGKTTTRTVTITVDGTASPTATINGTPFTIDLSGHTATKHD